MRVDPSRIEANIRAATNEDLLARATIERDQMEPTALAEIERELDRRGLDARARVDFQDQYGRCVRDADGFVRRCDRCPLPAVVEKWGWHRLFGAVPLFPRWFRYCREHAPM